MPRETNPGPGRVHALGSRFDGAHLATAAAGQRGAAIAAASSGILNSPEILSTFFGRRRFLQEKARKTLISLPSTLLPAPRNPATTGRASHRGGPNVSTEFG